MSKKFWLTWLGVVWLSGCGGNSSLGSGRDNESKLSTKGGTGEEEETDEATADSSDDDSTNSLEQQDAGVEGPVLSKDDDDTSASDDEMSAAGDDDQSGDEMSGDEISAAGDDDTNSSGEEGTNEGMGGGPSMVGGDGGASPEGTAGTTGSAGMSNVEPTDPSQLEPYELREGSFSMLAYSKTAGFPHTDSTASGKTLLQKIADQWDFNVVFTESNEDFTVAGLSQYEIVFFLNTSGDVLNGDEETAFETWMTEHNGAFAGTHSATDTESGWAFYSEVTGQYYDSHGRSGTTDQIEFEPTAIDHPALAGLPNPWGRVEEWFLFDKYQEWSAKPGFTILGRKAADGQPIMWTREWGNFRSFYTGLGHAAEVFNGDADVEKHITGGILWAVRREHWLN
jgi:uncharacterized protein